jgi:hypothetical protein
MRGLIATGGIQLAGDATKLKASFKGGPLGMGIGATIGAVMVPQ